MKRLIYLSPVPWASFAQRPHYFVRWWNQRNGGEVLWVDPYPSRLPMLADLRRLRGNPARHSGSSQPTWLTVLHPKALPIEPLPGSGLINGHLWRRLLHRMDDFISKGMCQLAIGKPSEFAVQLVRRHPQMPLLYDAMDDFPAFHRGLAQYSTRQREDFLVKKASSLLVSSTALYQRFAKHHEKMKLVLNACASDLLPSPRGLGVISERPVLGYVGTIHRWFDWSLVIAIARSNPEMTIRLIGPIYIPAGELLPPNVELFPACPHDEAMQAMREFSVGLIPFKRTPLTNAVDPVKFYEYRGLGIPVVSTRFGEMVHHADRGGVYLIDESIDLREIIQVALSERYKEKQIADFRLANSWLARFDSITNH